jgi:hypothetical protein
MARSQIKRLSVTTAVSLAVSLLCVGKASAYTFTRIADTSGSFSSFGSAGSTNYGGAAPAINDKGNVAFGARLDAGVAGIFTSSGGAITTIADTRSGSFSIFSFAPVINNSDTVAFRAYLKPSVEGIFSGNGREITTIADTNGSFSSFNFVGRVLLEPAINNEGIVAFNAGLDAGGSGIFASNGATTTIIVDNISSSSYYLIESPAINDAGTVAFAASLNTGGGGIFTVNRQTTTTIFNIGNSFGRFVHNPTINNAGTVAFRVFPELGVESILTNNGGSTTTIVDTNGLFRSFESFAINDADTVAFKAFLDNGGTGIFIEQAGVTNKVIATGDSLFGSTVTNLSFSSKGLNNSNQLAFFALLADGTSVIGRAPSGCEFSQVCTRTCFGVRSVGSWCIGCVATFIAL